jgi:hypothetical protein
MEPAVLAVGATGVLNANNSSADVLELINETESLRRALTAARPLLDTHASGPYPLLSLVRQGYNALVEAAVLLEDLPSDGTSTAVKMLSTLRKKRWTEKREAIISKVRIVNSGLIHIMRVLYVASRASNIQASLISRRDQRESQKEETIGEEIIIAVMGETGSGKSSFIQRVTRSDSVKTGHGLESGSLTFSNVCTHH